mgnify:CR=1 FL=1
MRDRVVAQTHGHREPGPQDYLKHWSIIKLTFADIANIHVMRASLKSFLNILSKRDPTDDDFLVDLHKCGWLEHIRKIIKTAADVATLIHQERSSVLVHCSDGWDRTAQCVCIAQLCMDPYYRTVRVRRCCCWSHTHIPPRVLIGTAASRASAG